jgi:hypothetical protein
VSESFVELLSPREGRLGHHTSSCINVAPAPVAFKRGEAPGEISDGLEAERDDVGPSSVDKAAPVVLHDVKEGIWRRGGLPLAREAEVDMPSP